MKKICSLILLLTLLLSLNACAEKTDFAKVSETEKIVITSKDGEKSVTVADAAFITNITDHVNYFKYKKVTTEEGQAAPTLGYTLSWLDENDATVKEITLYKDGTGIVCNGTQYAIKGEYFLDISYFDLIFENFSDRSIYRLPLFLVKCLFGAETLEAFWDVELPFYTEENDLRTKAYLDGDALLLFLTEEQKESLLAHFDSGLDEFSAQSGVTLSSDYSELSIVKPSEEVDEFLFDNFPLYAPHEMVLKQIFAGKNGADVSAKILVTDEQSGEVLYSSNWPHEEFKFTFGKSDT